MVIRKQMQRERRRNAENLQNELILLANWLKGLSPLIPFRQLCHYTFHLPLAAGRADERRKVCNTRKKSFDYCSDQRSNCFLWKIRSRAISQQQYFYSLKWLYFQLFRSRFTHSQLFSFAACWVHFCFWIFFTLLRAHIQMRLSVVRLWFVNSFFGV